MWYRFGDMRHRSGDPRLTGFARANRKSMSVIEGLMWSELRLGQLGVRFRRQEPIGPYIADFVCMPLQLVIELDGPSHDLESRYDARRDRYMMDRGFTVLRFTNLEVWTNREEVVRIIHDTLFPPSGTGGGGPLP